MDCGRERPQPENVERAMHHGDGRSVSGCQKNQTGLLSLALPRQLRWPRRKRPLALPRTSEMRHIPLQSEVIRGMSGQMKTPAAGLAQSRRFWPAAGLRYETAAAAVKPGPEKVCPTPYPGGRPWLTRTKSPTGAWKLALFRQAIAPVPARAPRFKTCWRRSRHVRYPACIARGILQ